MSLWLNLGQLATRAGRLLPTIDHLISWLTQPTADGKTLANSKGVDADLTDVNCLQFDGGVNKRVDINSAGGVDLTANTQTNLGSCVITSTFIQEGSTTDPQVIYACGAATYRLLIIDGYFHVNNLTADSYRIFAVELNKLYRTTLTYSATGAVTSFVLENLTDGTTQTDTTFRVHSNHGGTHGFQIGARTNGFNFNGKISNVSVTNSSKGAGFHLPLAEGSGTKAYDISGNNGHGIITGATWTTLDGIESWNHEYGFDINGAVKVPALNAKTKQVAAFDGVDDTFITEPVTLGNNFEFEWTGSISNTESFGKIVTNTNNTFNEGSFTFERISTFSPAKFVFYPNGGTRQESNNIPFDFDGSIHTHKITVNNGTLTYVVDNVTIYSNTFSAGNGFTNNLPIGIYSLPAGTNNCGGTLQNFKLTISGSTAFEYDFQSDIGTTTVQDLTTNNNDGTVSVGSSGLATFWGQRVADASGSLVSADYATGNTSISNPLGFVHNNSECGVKLQSRSVITGDGVSDFVTLPSLTPVRSKTIATKIKFPAAIIPEADNEEGAVYGLSGTGANLTPHLAVGFLRDSGDLERAFYFRDGNYVNGGYEISSNSTNYSTKYAGKTLWVIVRVDNENQQFHADIEGEFNITHNKSIDANATAPASLYNAGIGGWINTSSTDSGKVPIFDFIYYERVLSDSEVEGIYSGTIPSGAAYQYDFSEGQGTTITDSTSNGNNATATIGAGGTELFWADSYQEYEKIDLDQGFVPAQITVTDCTDTSLNGLYELDSTRNNDKLRWLKNNNTAQKVYFNSGSNRWTIQDSGGSVTKVGDTILPAEGSYDGGANLAYSTQGVFIKTSGTNITQIGQYDGDEVLTATEATLNDRYFG